MSFTLLTALSPLDGRYAAKLDALRPQFSEYGLIRRRLQVEIEWLKALAAEPHFAEIPAFSPATRGGARCAGRRFRPQQAAEVKDRGGDQPRREGARILDQEALADNQKSCASPSSSTSRAPPRTSTTWRTR
jgi:hypothetical protein